MFSQFVLGEFGREVSRPTPDAFDPIEIIIDASDDIPRRYLQRCEAELVYGGIFRELKARNFKSIEEGLYRVLASHLLGNPANRRFISLAEFAARIGPSIKETKRLQFILPGFPFKDQNVFRTEAPPDHVDLGDIALLIRLHVLALAFFQIHPFGADWIVLSDGTAYAEALGVEPRQAVSYREKLLDKRNELNLQGTVTILDLDEVAKHSDGEHFKGRFQNRVIEIQSSLSRLIASLEEIRHTFAVLVRGISWNLATRHYAERFAREEIWQAVTSIGGDSPRGSSALTREIYERGRKAALYYSAYNLALRWHGIPQRVFPSALRATVHPKAGQVAVPSLGPVYPWNGIPIVLKGSFRANDLVVFPWCDWRRNRKRLLGHAEAANLAPLYYTSLGGTD
jgi:hypothetical protein